MNLTQFEDGYDALEVHIRNRRRQAEIQVKEINIRFEMNNLFSAKRNEPNYEKFLEESLINAKVELMKILEPQYEDEKIPTINADDFELPLISADDLF